MGTDRDDTHAQELAYHQAQESRYLASVRDGRSRVPGAEVLEEVALDAGVGVRAPERSEYRMPAHFKKTMAPARLAKLQELMALLWDFRLRLVGLTERESRVVYKADPTALLLREEFHRLLEDHMLDRLARKSPRDRGSPVATFRRLVDEYVEWFCGFALAAGTGHTVVLGDIPAQVYSDLYASTWAGLTEWNPDGTLQGLRVQPEHQWYCFAILSSSDVARDGEVERTMEEHPSLCVDIDAGSASKELVCIAEDLLAFPARLGGSYRAEEHVLQVAHGLFAAWTWSDRQLAGVAFVGATRDDVVRQARELVEVNPVSIDLNGRAVNLGAPMRPLLSDQALAWTLGLMRRIHEHLFELWEQAGPPTAEADELQVVAQACEALNEASDEVDEEPIDPEEGRRVRVPGVRAKKLFSVLERVFGCEVTRGKGSEVTVYREGGKIYTLPQHKANPDYAAWRVRALLRTVGIDAEDFVSEVSKQVQYW